MIAIDNKLVSDEILEEKFVCDLTSCKGGCCEDGDAGAPIEDWEKDEIDKYLEIVKPYLTQEGLNVIEKKGKYVYDKEFGWVTPTINDGLCVYGYKNDLGVIQCGFEQAYNAGKIGWKKPVSCHLFPIRVSISKHDPDMEYVNYEPREELCAAACSLGKKLKVPVYEFLKEPIIRKYGEDFYAALEASAQHLKKK